MHLAVSLYSIPKPGQDGFAIEPLIFGSVIEEVLKLRAMLVKDLINCPSRSHAFGITCRKKGFFVSHEKKE